MLDQQSAAIAMKFFLKEVEDKMVELEEIKEYQESQKEERNRKLQNHHTL